MRRSSEVLCCTRDETVHVVYSFLQSNHHICRYRTMQRLIHSLTEIKVNVACLVEMLDGEQSQEYAAVVEALLHIVGSEANWNVSKDVIIDKSKKVLDAINAVVADESEEIADLFTADPLISLNPLFRRANASLSTSNQL